MLKVRLYGCLAELIGPEIALSGVGDGAVSDVRKRLAECHHGAADALNRSRALVGDQAVADDYRLAPLDELEFLPPVSGG